MRPVVALFGPTASGKTATAIALAERGGGEIVAADAMGLYAGLPTLTAQPTAEERARAPHRLVGVWPLDHEGDCAPLDRFGREVVPVGLGAGHREEHRTGCDRPRVVGEVEDLDRSPINDLSRPERGDEALQIHHRWASLPADSVERQVGRDLDVG